MLKHNTHSVIIYFLSVFSPEPFAACRAHKYYYFPLFTTYTTGIFGYSLNFIFVVLHFATSREATLLTKLVYWAILGQRDKKHVMISMKLKDGSKINMHLNLWTSKHACEWFRKWIANWSLVWDVEKKIKKYFKNDCSQFESSSCQRTWIILKSLPIQCNWRTQTHPMDAGGNT